jgi:hypothetical protein
MSRVAAHLNDAGITLLDEAQILYREPGFALLEDDGLTTGNAAFAQARINPRRIQHRYWSDLTTDALLDLRFSHLSAADLVIRQFEQMLDGVNDHEIVLAIPPYMNTKNLGLLLGIAAELNLNVVAMMDAAVAATRREYSGAVPVHVDVSVHSTMLTRLAQTSVVQVERSEVLQGCGSYAMFDTWLNAVSKAFVQQSRFDPLHTAATEQMLVNNMGQWLSSASSSNNVKLEIESGSHSYAAEIEALSLIGAAAPVYQQIASKLRSLFRADEIPAIQMTDRAARLPGLADMLKARVGGEVYVVEAGATARGALARFQESMDSGDGVSLIRQLPWDQAAVGLPESALEKSAAGAPSHMLFGNTAYAIGNSALIIGSDDTEAERMLVLDSDMPGVSRRHCSLRRVSGKCVLEDHSRYGTFLNGHRIDGSSVLQVGDTIRVGSPGFEFQLIITDENSG